MDRQLESAMQFVARIPDHMLTVNEKAVPPYGRDRVIRCLQAHADAMAAVHQALIELGDLAPCVQRVEVSDIRFGYVMNSLSEALSVTLTLPGTRLERGIKSPKHFVFTPDDPDNAPFPVKDFARAVAIHLRGQISTLLRETQDHLEPIVGAFTPQPVDAAKSA